MLPNMKNQNGRKIEKKKIGHFESLRKVFLDKKCIIINM
jgi:hypothetical protein